MLAVPEYPHHLIAGRNLSAQLPVHGAKLPFARGLLGSRWSSSTDGLGGCVFVTVKKYCPGIKFQGWGRCCNLREQKKKKCGKGKKRRMLQLFRDLEILCMCLTCCYSGRLGYMNRAYPWENLLLSPATPDQQS